MATITLVPTDIGTHGDHAVQIFWETLTTTNSDGSPVQMPGHMVRHVHVTGTFGAGGTVVIQGSNDNTNWVTLKDLDGADCSFTSTALVGVREIPRYTRPNVTAGDGTTDLDVTLIVAKGSRA